LPANAFKAGLTALESTSAVAKSGTAAILVTPTPDSTKHEETLDRVDIMSMK
jgi:hypothetical protein